MWVTGLRINTAVLLACLDPTDPLSIENQVQRGVPPQAVSIEFAIFFARTFIEAADAGVAVLKPSDEGEGVKPRVTEQGTRGRQQMIQQSQ